LYFPEHFAGRGLIKARFWSVLSDGFEETERTYAGGIGGIFWDLKRYLDVTLSGEIVDLVWVDFSYESLQHRAISQIAVVKGQLAVLRLWVLHEMFDASGRKSTVPTNDAMDFVALLDE
jgi:hypothetical protein